MLVAGGGPSGYAAALVAARHGKKVILIERNGYLGGMATAAGVTLLINRKAHDTYDMAGTVYREVIDALSSTPGATYCTGAADVVDPEAYKRQLEKSLIEAGVIILYHSWIFDAVVDETSVLGVRALTRQGIIRIVAGLSIDATGNGDLSFAAGCDMETLDAPMSMTTMVRIGNVDWKAAAASGRFSVHNGKYIVSGSLSGLFDRAKDDGVVTIPREGIAMSWANPAHPGEVFVNGTRIVGKRVLNSREVSEAEIIGRNQAQEILCFFRSYVPGFADCYLIGTGPEIGVRESRRIVPEYRLCREDVLEMRSFHDAVSACSYAIDVHSPTGSGTEMIEIHERGIGAYQIPFRSCVPRGWDGILTVGRCAGADTQAAGSFRVMPSVMTLAQGAVEYYFDREVTTLDRYSTM